jgi:hypothetical protein
MQVIAEQEGGVYLLVNDVDVPNANADGMVLDTGLGVLYPALPVLSILKQGYWEIVAPRDASSLLKGAALLTPGQNPLRRPDNAGAAALSEFREELHPRDKEGQFAVKPENRPEPPRPTSLRVEHKRRKRRLRGPLATSPGTDGLANDTASYLRSLNLPVPDFTVSLDQGVVNPNMGAAAVPGAVYFRPEWFSWLQWCAARKDAGLNPGAFAVEAGVLLLHEALHQVFIVPYYNTPEWTEEQAALEEGLVEAMTYDLAKNYLRFMFGERVARLFDPTSAMASVYKDRLVEVRRRSSRATGKPWHSPEAFEWRAGLLRKPPAERKAEWDKWPA